MARTNYNKNFESASAVTKDIFAKPVVDKDGNIVQLGDGEIALVTTEGQEGIWGYNHLTDKPVQFNSTKVIRMSEDYSGTTVNAGDTINQAFNKIENIINNLSGQSESTETDLKNIKEAVGLDEDGKHIPSTGNYTSAATTVEGEIAALDAALKETNDNLAELSASTKDGLDGLDGKIEELSKEVEANKVKSEGSTIIVTEGEDGTNIEVNLDNATIVSKDGKVACALTLKKLDEPSSPDYLASYVLGYEKDGNFVTVGDIINLGKDLVVSKGEVIVVDDEHPVEGLNNGTYIKLTIANQEKAIYINCKDLIDVYTGVSGITVSDKNEIGIKISDFSDKHPEGGWDYLTTNKYDGGLVISGMTDFEKRISALEDAEEGALNRTVYCGNTATYSAVETNVVWDSEAKKEVKVVTVKNVLKDIKSATADNDGIPTAYGVQQYIRSTVDGDDIYVGDNPIPAVDGGRLDDNSLDEGYDTVHVALKKFDIDFERIARMMGVEETGKDLLKFPIEYVKANTKYMSGATTVMEALYALDEAFTTVSDDLRKDIDELSANTVTALKEVAVKSDGESIIVSEPTEDGTNIEVNIHEGAEVVENTVDDVKAKDKNFLEQMTDGDKGLAVRGMDSDVTVTTAPIRILGWTNQVGSGVYSNWNGTDKTDGDTGINTIPAGKSVQEILENLLSHILYPNAATKPSISVTLGAALSGLKEIGSTVTVPGATVATNNGKFNASYTNVSQPTPAVNWTGTSISTSKTGFTDYVIDIAETIAAGTGKVALGENKVEYAATSTYSEPTNSPVRNDNEATTKTGKTAADKTATWASSAATASKSVSVTGVYPVFNNINGNALATDTVTKMALQSGNTITIENIPAESDEAHFMFDFPSDRTVTSFLVKDLSGNYVNYTGAYTTTETVVKAINGASYVYSRINLAGGAKQGITSYRVVLSKSLNQ